MGSQTSVPVQGSPNAHPASNPIASFVPMLFVIGVIYFLLIRPQQRAAKQLKNEVDALKKDDKVLTQGGIYGIVRAIKGDAITILGGKVRETGQEVEIEISRQAVTRVFPAGSAS